MTVKKLMKLLQSYKSNSNVKVCVETVEEIAVDVDTVTESLENITDVIDRDGDVLIAVRTRHVPPY